MSSAILLVVLIFSQAVTESNDPTIKPVQCDGIKDSQGASIIVQLEQAASDTWSEYQKSCEGDGMLDLYYRDPDALDRKCTILLQSAESAKSSARIGRIAVERLLGCRK